MDENNNNEKEEKNPDVFVPADPENVRRRLFQEGEEENQSSSQGYECIAEPGEICSSTWGSNRNGASTNKDDVKDKEVISNFLLITNNEDISLGKLLEDRAEFILGLAKVHHCSPEEALRLCCTTTFKLVFLDLNTDNLESILRIVVTIRGSAFPNQTVPVVALKHSGNMKEEYWRKYGISDVVYGPLYFSMIEHIITKWLSIREKQDIQTNTNEVTIISEGNVAANLPKEEKEKAVHPIYKQPFTRVSAGEIRDGPAYIVDLTQSKSTCTWIPPSRHPSPFQGGCDSTCPSTSYVTPEYPTPAPTPTPSPVPSTIAHYTAADSSYVQEHHQWSSTYSSGSNPSSTYSNAVGAHTSVHNKPSNVETAETSRPIPPPILNTPTTTAAPTSGGPNNWNLIQQILDIHSHKTDHKQKPPQKDDSRGIGKSTPVSGNSTFNYPTPPLLSGPRPYISHMAPPPPPPPNVTIPPNASYMINGTPGTSSMRLALVPEEFQKHSSKERERRERIKACCDEIRRVLPKHATEGRRLDMATVMEMAVNYIKIHQHHLPMILQQQLNQAFVNIYQKDSMIKRKKEMQESARMPSNAPPPSKVQRIQPAPTYITSCPLGSYSGPTYLPQMMQNNPPTSAMSYYPPMYPPVHLGPTYIGPLTPAPSPNLSSSMGHGGPVADHAISGRQQCLPEYIQSQSASQCYMSASSAVREPVANNPSKDNAHTNSHF